MQTKHRSKMKQLVRIKVIDLFGLYNYTIPIHFKDGLTILFGLNGCGKTTILKMIDLIFRRQYFQLGNMLFSEVILSFNDREHISFKKTYPKDSPDSPQLSIESSKFKDQPFLINQKALLDGIDEDRLHYFYRRYYDEDFFPVKRISTHEWFDYNSKDKMSAIDVYRKYSDYLSELLPVRFNLKEPEWLNQALGSISVSFLEAERLQKKFNIEKKGRYDSDIEERQDLTVNVYSNYIKDMISDNLAKYTEMTQTLDRTFPYRVMKESKNIDIETLSSKFIEMDKKRKRLMDTGLLDQYEEIGKEGISLEKDKGILRVLQTYVMDMQKKYEVFDDITNKLEIFKEIINRKFRNKKIILSKTDGIAFEVAGKNNEKATFPVNRLSSGEQHEVVMLYKLIFETPTGSLLLIDEPEISLHVEWQRTYLDEIEEIAKMYNFNVIVATHSPQIISDKMDQTVELLPF